MNKRLLLSTAILLLATGCQGIMRDMPRYEPLEASAFFPDGRSARPLVEGVVSQDANVEDEAFNTGVGPDGALLATSPVPPTRAVLERGREQYDIFCAPCHGYAGYGDGMIVQRGFSPPPSFHQDRLRDAPDGHYFDVITNGFGQMYSYAYRVKTADRWAIVAYIRALQLSQNASREDIPLEGLPELENSNP